MTLQSWLIYLLFVLAATATPGPAVLFIMTNAALHGRHKAVFCALGNITGLLFMGILSVTGLGALLSASEPAFNLIKYCGAAYLIYLGVKLCLQKGPGLNEIQDEIASTAVPSSKLFLQAFIVAVSNPKAIVFLTALFPQFINIDAPLPPQFLILIATLMILSFTFLMTYGILAHQAKTWLAAPRRVRCVSRVSGAVFMGFGVLLAASSHG